MKSILQDEKECYVCRLLYDANVTHSLVEHHIFAGTANRRKSEQHGLKIFVTADFHTGHAYSIHSNKKLYDRLKTIGQKAFEDYHQEQGMSAEESRAFFMREFGKNYL